MPGKGTLGEVTPHIWRATVTRENPAFSNVSLTTEEKTMVSNSVDSRMQSFVQDTITFGPTIELLGITEHLLDGKLLLLVVIA